MSTTNAQNIPASATGLDLTASTDFPNPGQEVTITARSYSIDINSAKVIWTVNGLVKQNAVGATTLVVVAPNLGKRLATTVIATTPDGSVVSATLDLGSGSVDMILEPDGFVPPLFQGKLPPVYQNTVKIIAVPHIADSSGKEYDPKTLIYKWERNGQVVEDLSGYGRQFANMKGSIVPRPFNMTVTATTRDGSAQAVGNVAVSAQDPSVAFYVNDPLYGTLYNRAVDDSLRIGTEKETGVLAVPFGFNKYANRDNLTMKWLINSVLHPELANNPSVVLRAPTDAGGESEIQLTVGNTTDILQGIKGGFTAVFKADTNDNQGNPVSF